MAVSLCCAVFLPDLVITWEGCGGLSNTSWWGTLGDSGHMTYDLLAWVGVGVGFSQSCLMAALHRGGCPGTGAEGRHVGQGVGMWGPGCSCPAIPVNTGLRPQGPGHSRHLINVE